MLASEGKHAPPLAQADTVATAHIQSSALAHPGRSSVANAVARSSATGMREAIVRLGAS